MNIQTIDLLIRYHIWATQGLTTALEPLSDEDFCKDCGLFFQSISGTFNHLLLADHLWFSRFYHGFSPILPLNHILEPDRTYGLAQTTQSKLSAMAKLRHCFKSRPFK
ncbi:MULTISPECIES: DinB family protein [unclassified Acinetobacter]|uniref:DinB family protein n=1 Tax=unclassified Acinetobacter TaxID=196816 RepID=UPI0029E7E5AD|nr:MULTISPECIES: DinB family protein [unclassified Acinetobacter]